MDSTSWFSAKCLFHARHTESDTCTLAELRYFLIAASDEAVALERGATLARSKEHAYHNAEGKEIRWEFARVLDVKELMNFTLHEGAEVYYEYLDLQEGPKQ